MDTRRKLVRCALKELEQKGLEEFSLRAVGAKAGLSAMAVYRHFASKEDLLRAVGDDAFAAYQERAAKIRDGPLDDWLRKVARVYVAFALDDPGHFEACFVLQTRVERIYPEDFRAGKSPVIGLIVARIEVAQAAGLVRKGDAVEWALLLWANVHGLVMLHRAGRFSLSRTAFLALAERVVELFCESVRTKRKR